jgi:hypothetical protein
LLTTTLSHYIPYYPFVQKTIFTKTAQKIKIIKVL